MQVFDGDYFTLELDPAVSCRALTTRDPSLLLLVFEREGKEKINFKPKAGCTVETHPFNDRILVMLVKTDHEKLHEMYREVAELQAKLALLTLDED